MTFNLTIHPIPGLPLVQPGDDLADLIDDALSADNTRLMDGDVLVIAQKIVSKSEGRIVKLSDIEPSEEAARIGAEVDKDPRLVELILRESTEVVRMAPGVIIVRHRLGIVSANAGIDQSNVEQAEGECALLLPRDPDRSARRLRRVLEKRYALSLGVIVSDSMNRPWRLGTIGYAIGSSGVAVLDDRRGQEDIFGREMKVSMSNQADSIATAAMLVMGETTERIPAALVRGLPWVPGDTTARDCIRPLSEDLFL